MRMERLWTTLALAAVMGCAHGSVQSGMVSPKVSEDDVARLGPEQARDVDQARKILIGAKDDQLRATVKLQEASRQESSARSEQKKANEALMEAENQVQLATTPDSRERARLIAEQARLRKQAADARVDYTTALVEKQSADVQAVEQQIRSAEARVELAKIEALSSTNDPAMEKYDAAQFREAANKAQKDADQATQKAGDLEYAATNARQRWEDSERMLQPRGASEQAGTGSLEELPGVPRSGDSAEKPGLDLSTEGLLSPGPVRTPSTSPEPGAGAGAGSSDAPKGK